MENRSFSVRSDRHVADNHGSVKNSGTFKTIHAQFNFLSSLLSQNITKIGMGNPIISINTGILESGLNFYSAVGRGRNIPTSVCPRTCMSFREHISGTICLISPNVYARYSYGHGSILLWRHCDKLCTSGFINDVTRFSLSWPIYWMCPKMVCVIIFCSWLVGVEYNAPLDTI